MTLPSSKIEDLAQLAAIGQPWDQAPGGRKKETK